MLYPPNILFSDCWSSVGNITFYHRDGKCYWRMKSSPTFPGTIKQLSQLDVHRRALKAWGMLDMEEQLQWNEYAESVPARRPPFDDKNHISGYNLFVSAYHGFAQLGNEHTPSPHPMGEFPIFHMEFVDAIRNDSENVSMRFRLFLDDVEDESRYRVLCKVQIGTVGIGLNNGKMRNYLAESASDMGISYVFVTVPHTSVEDSAQIHMRYMILDTKTGYRSKYKKASFVITIQSAS